MSIQLLLFILVSLLLSSCSFHSEKTPPIVEEPAEAIETTTREAIFTYGQNSDLPAEVTLILGSEPLLLGESYVRLVGVVGGGGGRPIALVELGGRGLAVETGEKVGSFKVESISEKEVKLKCLRKS